MTLYPDLRSANAARQLEWDPKGVSNANSWRINELAGEIGEVCNVLKKLHRERHNIPGSRATLADLSEELADVVICVDLALMSSKIAPVRPKFGISCAQIDLPVHGGHLFTSAAKFASASLQPTYTRAAMAQLVVQNVYDIARQEGFNYDVMVALKFNATSVKMNLGTTLHVPS